MNTKINYQKMDGKTCGLGAVYFPPDSENEEFVRDKDGNIKLFKNLELLTSWMNNVIHENNPFMYEIFIKPKFEDFLIPFDEIQFINGIYEWYSDNGMLFMFKESKVTKALDLGYQVIANDLYNTGIDTRAEFCEVPIFSEDTGLYEKLGKPDICIHMAWQDGFSHNAPSHILNLSKHYDFLMKLVDKGCQHIAVMGTMHEVGYWEGKIDENTPCSPMSLYGIAKNALRQALLLQAQQKNFKL